jgi:hypothetical protein
MALQIPSRYIPILNDIRNLPEAAVAELLQALESSSITSSPHDLSAHIAESVPRIPREELDRIVDVLYSLYHVRQFSEMNRSSFLKELVEGVSEHARPKISDDEIHGLRERFKSLLSIKTLDSISKAIGLQRDGERLYCETKIISDIRPVFGEDVKSRPVAATITHTLKITYHESGDHKEFFVTLDQVDLDELQGMVKRAKAKAETLTKLLTESGIPRLGL